MWNDLDGAVLVEILLSSSDLLCFDLLCTQLVVEVPNQEQKEDDGDQSNGNDDDQERSLFIGGNNGDLLVFQDLIPYLLFSSVLHIGNQLLGLLRWLSGSGSGVNACDR